MAKTRNIVKRIGCLFGTHAREYRKSKNPDFSENPDYTVCLDCNSAEREIAPIPYDQKQKINRSELSEMERLGFEIDEPSTIYFAGIKRHHLSRYNQDNVNKSNVPLKNHISGIHVDNGL